MDENRKVREKFMFPQNNLVVTSIDIQSVEPVDQRTRDSLQKSVQLAIEITTNSQEAAARLERNLQLWAFLLGTDYKFVSSRAFVSLWINQLLCYVFA